jgi:undecaprenyl-diphosphatase
VKRSEQILFGLSSFAILIIIGLKLHELDMPMARFVRSFDIAMVNQIGDLVALLGQGALLTGLFAAIALVGWRLKRDRLKAMGVRGLIALLLGTVVVQLMKHLIGRPRPRFAHADEFVIGPSIAGGLDSFPSGHVITWFAAAALIGWFLPKARIFLFVLGGLVAASRVVRGSHFPTDVYTGAVLGVVIGTLVAAGIRESKSQALPQLIRVGVPWIVVLFFVIWVIVHRAPSWPQELPYLAAGIGLVLVGMLLRVGVLLWRNARYALQAAGNTSILLGVGVACGPWWMAVLLVAAFLPYLIHLHRNSVLLGGLFADQEPAGRRPYWQAEAIAVSAAVLGILVLHSLQGLLPLAS